MTPYILLAWAVGWSCALASEISSECAEPLLRQCRCGESGRHQDVYVPSCRVYTADNSSICEPCPGSCGAYELCQRCSKQGCLSCPPGRWGPFCENTETAEAARSNHTDTHKDGMKSQAQEEMEEIQANFDSFHAKPEDSSYVKNRPEETLAKDQNRKSNKNHPNPIAVTDSAKEDGSSEYLKNDMEIVLYADVYGSNVNPEISQSFVNRTRKFFAEQKPKETLTVMRDSLKESGKEELLPPTSRAEKATDTRRVNVFSSNGSLIPTNSSSPRVLLNFYSESINSSDDRNLKEIISETYSNGKLDNSSVQRKMKFRFPDDASLGESEKLDSSYESLEVNPGANSEENEKLNISNRQWKSAFEDPEAQESANLEQQSYGMADQPSEQKSNVQSGWFFNLKDAQFSSLSFPSMKQTKLHSSEPETESAQLSNDSDNLRADHRSAFNVQNSGLKERNFSQILSNKQSDFTRNVSESDPFNINIFKVRIIDSKGGGINADTNKQSLGVNNITKSFEMSEDQVSKLYESDSKEYDIISPLEINVFNITFLNDASGNQHSSNITERRIVGDSEELEASQNKTIETPGNTVRGLKDSISESSMDFPAIALKGNNGSSSDESNRNKTARFPEEKKESNIKKKAPNHKRNVTDRQRDSLLYNDILYNMIRPSGENIMNKAQKSDDQQLHTSQSFSKMNIPENQILIPLYFPETYNAEQYQRSFIDNGHVKKLCDLFPNYSLCFRVRMLSPESAILEQVDSRPQIPSEDSHHRNSPNKMCQHQSPRLSSYDNTNIPFYTGNQQDRLTDMKISNLLSEYFKAKYAQTASSTPVKSTQPAVEDPIFSTLKFLIQGRNKESESKEGLVSTILSTLINNFLSLIFSQLSIVEPSTPNEQEVLKSIPEQPEVENEVEDIPPNANQPLQAGSIPDDSNQFDTSKDDAESSAQSNSSSTEDFRKSADTFQIKIIRPIFDPTSFEKDGDREERLNALQSDEDTLFESCPNCIFSESFYETGSAEEKKENPMPTIFRALIVEEGLLSGNKSDPAEQNASRSKRSLFNNDTQSWCPIQKRMLNGDLDCTIWSYQKLCTLICHRGYSSRSNKFKCLHSTQTWTPNLDPCMPVQRYAGFGYRDGNNSSLERELDLLPDGNFENDNDTSFSDNSRLYDLFAEGRRNQTSDDYEGLPGFRNFEPKDNSTFDNSASFAVADKRNDSSAFRGFSPEGAVHEEIGKTRDNTDILGVDGKDAADADGVHEKPSSSSKTKYRPEEKKQVAEKDTVYSYFEKGDPEPKSEDSW